LQGLDLGADVLEIGPGFAATTRVLARRPGALTALEINDASVRRVAAELGDTVRIVHGDGTAMPFADDAFSAVVCFSMLHHVPSPELQDRLFAEAIRVVRPGGVFAGSDYRSSRTMTLFHLGDTLVPVAADTLAKRLTRAGLTQIQIAIHRRRIRFRGIKRA
jgi:SAM-dependent methyltransferase